MFTESVDTQVVAREPDAKPEKLKAIVLRHFQEIKAELEPLMKQIEAAPLKKNARNNGANFQSVRGYAIEHSIPKAIATLCPEVITDDKDIAALCDAIEVELSDVKNAIPSLARVELAHKLIKHIDHSTNKIRALLLSQKKLVINEPVEQADADSTSEKVTIHEEQIDSSIKNMNRLLLSNITSVSERQCPPPESIGNSTIEDGKNQINTSENEEKNFDKELCIKILHSFNEQPVNAWCHEALKKVDQSDKSSFTIIIDVQRIVFLAFARQISEKQDAETFEKFYIFINENLKRAKNQMCKLIGEKEADEFFRIHLEAVRHIAEIYDYVIPYKITDILDEIDTRKEQPELEINDGEKWLDEVAALFCKEMYLTQKHVESPSAKNAHIHKVPVKYNRYDEFELKFIRDWIKTTQERMMFKCSEMLAKYQNGGIVNGGFLEDLCNAGISATKEVFYDNACDLLRGSDGKHIAEEWKGAFTRIRKKIIKKPAVIVSTKIGSVQADSQPSTPISLKHAMDDLSKENEEMWKLEIMQEKLELEKQRAKLSEDKKQIEIKIADIAAEKVRLDGEKIALQSEKVKIASNAEILRAQKEIFEEEEAALNEMAQDLMSRESELNAQKRVLQDEFRHIMVLKTELQNEQDRLQAENTRIAELNMKLQLDFQKLSEERDTIAEERRELELEKSELLEERSEIENERQELESEKQELEDALEELETQQANVDVSNKDNPNEKDYEDEGAQELVEENEANIEEAESHEPTSSSQFQKKMSLVNSASTKEGAHKKNKPEELSNGCKTLRADLIVCLRALDETREYGSDLIVAARTARESKSSFIQVISNIRKNCSPDVVIKKAKECATHLGRRKEVLQELFRTASRLQVINPQNKEAISSISLFKTVEKDEAAEISGEFFTDDAFEEILLYEIAQIG